MATDPTFAKLTIEGAKRLADMKLTGRAYSVLFGLISLSEWRGLIYITQEELAKKLKMESSQVAKCLKTLVDEGVITRPKARGCYRFSAFFLEFGLPAGKKGKSDEASMSEGVA